MKTFTACAIATLLGSLAAAPAFADHNSPMGECWAKMPNDIHNIRMDTLTEDQDEFLSLVQYGAGADLPNRCTTDTTSSVRPTTSGTDSMITSGGSSISTNSSVNR